MRALFIALLGRPPSNCHAWGWTHDDRVKKGIVEANIKHLLKKLRFLRMANESASKSMTVNHGSHCSRYCCGSHSLLSRTSLKVCGSTSDMKTLQEYRRIGSQLLGKMTKNPSNKNQKSLDWLQKVFSSCDTN